MGNMNEKGITAKHTALLHTEAACVLEMDSFPLT